MKRDINFYDIIRFILYSLVAIAEIICIVIATIRFVKDYNTMKQSNHEEYYEYRIKNNE